MKNDLTPDVLLSISIKDYNDEFIKTFSIVERNLIKEIDDDYNNTINLLKTRTQNDFYELSHKNLDNVENVFKKIFGYSPFVSSLTIAKKDKYCDSIKYSLDEITGKTYDLKTKRTIRKPFNFETYKQAVKCALWFIQHKQKTFVLTTAQVQLTMLYVLMKHFEWYGTAKVNGKPNYYISNELTYDNIETFRNEIMKSSVMDLTIGTKYTNLSTCISQHLNRPVKQKKFDTRKLTRPNSIDDIKDYYENGMNRTMLVKILADEYKRTEKQVRNWLKSFNCWDSLDLLKTTNEPCNDSKSINENELSYEDLKIENEELKQRNAELEKEIEQLKQKIAMFESQQMTTPSLQSLSLDSVKKLASFTFTDFDPSTHKINTL